MKRLILIAGTLLAAACGGPSAQAVDGALPADHPQLSGPALGETSATKALGGEVLEILVSGGYSYARLAVPGGEIWAAGPESSLEVGQSVRLTGASLMTDFTSSSLDRTFEEIYFVSGFQMAGVQAAGTPPPPPSEGSSGEALEVLDGGGYIYVHVQVGENTLWIAGQGPKVEEGDSVAWSGALSMGDFHSPTLDRTFDNMFFVSRMWVTQ